MKEYNRWHYRVSHLKADLPLVFVPLNFLKTCQGLELRTLQVIIFLSSGPNDSPRSRTSYFLKIQSVPMESKMTMNISNSTKVLLNWLNNWRSKILSFSCQYYKFQHQFQAPTFVHVLVVDSWTHELLKPPCNVNWGTNSNEHAALFQHHVLSQQMILSPIQESFYFCPDLQLESFGLPPSRAQHLSREQELPDVRARDLWIIYIFITN